MPRTIEQLWLWCRLVGRVTPAGVGRMGPRLTWAVVGILCGSKGG